MKNKLAPLTAALMLLSATNLVGCEDDDVGIPCQMGAAQTPETKSSQLNSQAMDCRSRLCLLYGGLTESRPLCTKICGDDGDCPDSSEACPSGFQCIPAVETTSLAYCKMCVCKDFIAGDSVISGGEAGNCPEM